MPKNVLHSKSTVKWGTPKDIVERARRTMGGITLDPCSSIKFDLTVNADRYYSLDDHGEDGLALPWYGKVFCNPPGGSLVRGFWRKAMSEPIEQMIWVGFSLEQLALLADERNHPMDFSICVPRKRIRFTRDDDYGGSPTHSNYICGYKVDHGFFVENFADLGKVYAPGNNRVPA